MRVTYIGTSGDPDEITHRGVAFERGKAVTVPDDHEFADDFRNNPTFAIGAAEAKAALAAMPDAE
jgi:hypothetical protein